MCWLAFIDFLMLRQSWLSGIIPTWFESHESTSAMHTHCHSFILHSKIPLSATNFFGVLDCLSKQYDQTLHRQRVWDFSGWVHCTCLFLVKTRQGITKWMSWLPHLFFAEQPKLLQLVMVNYSWQHGYFSFVPAGPWTPGIKHGLVNRSYVQSPGHHCMSW